MDIIDKLNNKFLKQDFTQAKRSLYSEELEKYKGIACNYARMENAISVLSDMHTNISYIYYGGFSKVLGMNDATDAEDKINSIWEENILKQIHPEDLHSKYLQELRFFHFMKHQPQSKRADYYFANELRMRDVSGNYSPALHRLFYIPASFDNSIWLALCLYAPLIFELPNRSVVINSTTGQMIELRKRDDSNILSDREKQVLRLINKGMMSKSIAEMLSISINTVSRHRQEILGKLQVRSSIEACRIAKDLGIIQVEFHSTPNQQPVAADLDF